MHIGEEYITLLNFGNYQYMNIYRVWPRQPYFSLSISPKLTWCSTNMLLLFENGIVVRTFSSIWITQTCYWTAVFFFHTHILMELYPLLESNDVQCFLHHFVATITKKKRLLMYRHLNEHYVLFIIKHWKQELTE